MVKHIVTECKELESPYNGVELEYRPVKHGYCLPEIIGEVTRFGNFNRLKGFALNIENKRL